jgi:hypothetical protein
LTVLNQMRDCPRVKEAHSEENQVSITGQAGNPVLQICQEYGPGLLFGVHQEIFSPHLDS